MNPSEDRVVTALRVALKDNERLRDRIDTARAAATEPIAVLGMACRFPGGVSSPEDFWALLIDERDAITPFPDDRDWESVPATDRGGFLAGVAEFDAALFGISPREAVAMDPQQRLLLETSWEAIERSRIDPRQLRGSRTGVFAGVMNNEYGSRLSALPDDVLGYVGNGSAGSVASGRVAFTLGLEGPAVTVDTACSSSLVAVHLAAQALRRGDCDLALAAGVTVMATPGTFREFRRQGALSADGRCKAFADAADGTGLAEGAGTLLLCRLSDARRDNRPVLATIRGSAVNQDGASNGLTAPNGAAQQRMIRAAVADAGLTTAEIDAVEGHGTGTRLGDPIEAHAVLATYGQDRPADRPLWLGSVKSNLGHTQAAAGIAGVIKMILAMRHGVLPSTLHVDRPSRYVDWAQGDVRLLTSATAWPSTGGVRRAGVSSFGVSGTNAHVILECDDDQRADRPPIEPAGTAPEQAPPLVLSGRTAGAVREQSVNLARLLIRQPERSLTDVAHALATTRAALDFRASVPAGDRDAVRAALADGDFTIRRAVEDPRVAFMFAGQGAQRVGMGRELAARFPAFREALDNVLEHLGRAGVPGLREIIENSEELHQTGHAQPALFAFEVALTALFASWGVSPHQVLGHSVGEIAAAHIAGVFSLADACRIVVARGRLMQELPSGGAMVAIQASESELDLPPGVDLAAVNGPEETVVSGPEPAVSDWLTGLTGRRTRRLRVSHAFHSAAMEPMLDAFRSVLQGVRFQEPRIALISALTGRSVTTEIADPEYWVRHARETVRFADAVAAARSEGATTYLEIGTNSVLTALVASTVDNAAAVPSLRGSRSEADAVLAAVGELHSHGITPTWAAVFDGLDVRPVDLPTYPFQRQRYWLRSAAHPLIRDVVPVAGTPDHLLTAELSADAQPWLRDHAVTGTILVPGTVIVELVLQAAGGTGCRRLADLVLHTPMVVPDQGALSLQVTVGAPNSAGERPVTVHGRLGPEQPWSRHADGLVAEAPTVPSLVPWPPEDAVAVEADELYARLSAAGVDYGLRFRGVRTAWIRGSEVFAEVECPLTPDDRYLLHPALFDAALHGAALVPDAPDGLPFAWRGVCVHATATEKLRVHLRPDGTGGVTVSAVDPQGEPVLTVESLAARPWKPAGPELGDGRLPLWKVRWCPVEVPAHRAPPVTVVGGDKSFASLATRTSRDLPTEADGFVLVPMLSGVTARAAHSAVQHARSVLDAWLAVNRPAEARLVVLTTGDLAGLSPAPAAAAVWGLVRSAQIEHPDRFVLVDVDGTTDSYAAVGRVLAGGEPQTAIQAGTVHVPRLVPDTSAEPPRLVRPATVLITGGTGALGLLVARHLIEAHQVRDLVLLSRHPQPVPEFHPEASVRVVACDVRDRAALGEVVAGIDDLAMVIHAAGVTADAPVTTLTGDQIDRVLAVKADGAENLYELTRHRDLDAFVLFSSAAGTLGSAGQGNYAAGNAFLDAFATRLWAGGFPAVSMAWGLWDHGAGMAARLGDGDRARLVRDGVIGLSEATGLRLFDAALTSGVAALVPAGLDIATLRTLPRRSPLLNELVGGPVREPTAKVVLAAEQPWQQSLTTRPAADPAEALLELVRKATAAVLGHRDAASIEPEMSFRDLGFDSLTSVELRNRLSDDTGLRLPATLVFDHPTAVALAGHLRDELLGDAPAPEPSACQLASGSDDTIAIVAMSCRYPGGVETPEQLWELIAEGRDAVSGFPVDRGWDADALYDPDPARRGTSYVREGGFLHEAAGFDAEFFGISPREAVAMDPQQRLLLETAWEVFERAGMDPKSARGTRTGVFVGLMYHDYAARLHAVPEDVEGHLGSGNAASVASGRIAYTFGLEGPVLTVDTACSSSLVSLHLATQALRQGECALAIAGGVTVMATPAAFVEFSRQRGLAADGRCKSFADAADGTAWGEGAGLLLLERLSDARRNGRRVLAVLRGSAVNSDGASNGLTAPNGPAQQRVIRQALAAAGLTPAEVDAVEAHGTGTSLGDPIEAQALLATYGRERRDGQPLWLGSIKSNIGHTQAAAGVAGVIKMVLAMRHGILPATLHVDEPSTKVDWSTGAVALLREPRSWPSSDAPRRAAVSSFGISGTNAHVIIEAGDGDDSPAEPVDQAVPVVFSARNPVALRAFAGRLAELSCHPADLADQLIETRSSLEVRGAVIAHDRSSLRRGLTAMADGLPSAMTTSGTARPDRRLALMCGGQGIQRVGMGRELAARFPVFDDALSRLCATFARVGVDGLREVMWTSDEVHNTAYAQPALFAFEVATANLLASWDVRAETLMGHSLGEIVATHLAGVLDDEDACRVVAARGRLMGALPSAGAMLAVRAAESELDLPDGVEIAAVNSDSAVVLAGADETLTVLAGQLTAGGYRVRRLRTGHAFHSALMEPMLAPLAEILADVTFRPARIPLVSALTGKLVDDAEMTTDFWIRHTRQTVRFAEAVRTARDLGITDFLEIGPDSALSAPARESLGNTAAVHTTAITGHSEDSGLLLAVAGLHTRGSTVDWVAVREAAGLPAGAQVTLPTYPFQRRRFWLDDSRPPVVEGPLWQAILRRDIAAVAASTGLAPEAPMAALLPKLAEALAAAADGGSEPAADPRLERGFMRRRLTDVTGPERERILLDHLLTEMAVVLGHESAADIDPDGDIFDLGFASLTALEMRERLVAATGLDLPPTLLFDHVTATDLMRHLSEELTASQPVEHS
ncbi:SDR family NAD(P)-dependent oxidoreductase [Micromonospora wenchangensis]|uniref:SDR family NAD(P)-dependent oxidoreductase n=1 Tax=Micromonospora wenchangensis TaxID=1185415 RepID=UPI003D73E995